MSRFTLKLFVIRYVLGLGILVTVLSCGGGDQTKQIDFIIDWEPGLDYIGYYVADHEKYYEDEGISVNFRHVNGAPLSANLIGSGKSLIGTTTADQVVLATTRRETSNDQSEENLELGAIATIFKKNPVEIISLSNDPIEKIQDLKGKRLGMNSASVTFRQFILVAQRQGIESDIQFIDIGWGGAEQLLEGEIDALLAYTMERPVALELELEQRQDVRRVIRLPLGTVDTNMDIIGQVIAVHKPSFHNPEYTEVLKKVVRASLRGWAFVIENQDKALEIFGNRYSISNSAYARRSLEKTIELLPTNIQSYLIESADWERVRDAVAGIEEAPELRSIPIERFVLNGLDLD